jgi:hypothetical protein
VADVEQRVGFHRRRLIDLSVHERDGHYLEGTGSLVLDHRMRVTYACRSARTHEGLLGRWAQLLGYVPLVFDARGPGDRAPYHTNVMLAIGTRWAIVCAHAIVPADRRRVLASLAQSGRAVVQISPEAMQRFAGNVLELRTAAAAAPKRMAGPMGGERSVLVMSASAAAALQAQPGAWRELQGSVDDMIAIDVGSIEQAGGGSVRCMLAEVFAV